MAATEQELREERAGVVSEDRTVQVLQAVVTVRIPMSIPSAGDSGR